MKRLYIACLIFFIISYLPFFNQVSPLVNGIFVLNLLLSFWQEGQKRRISQVIRVGIMMMGLAVIFNENQTLWGLEPGVAVLTLMATLKIFEINTKRDFFLFALIVELALVGHVLMVDQLYMVLYILVISIGLFGLLFTYHNGGQAEAEVVQWTAERKKVFLQIFLYSLPLAFALFFLFPRLTLGNLFFNTMKKKNMTGFAEEVRPGSVNEVVQNKTPYFRAKFLNGKTPSYFELYWRGAILSQTDGLGWKRVKPPGKEREEFSKSVKYSYELTYDSFMNSPLFFLEDTKEFQRQSRGHILNRGARTYKFFPYSNQKITFTAQTSKIVKSTLSPQQRRHYLQLPKLVKRKRFTEWVESLKFKKKSLRSYAKRFSRRIEKEKFVYTLAPGQLGGDAPLDQFFFKTKKGFCEHYAATFALYLRLLGVPSRVVVGFHGGEYNPLGKYYVVRGLDAHAWVEAWDEKRGWQRFDPTGYVAPDRIRYGSASYFVDQEDTQGVSLDVYLEGRSNEFWQGLIFAMDMIYYEANRKFVGFDLDRQKRIFSFLGEEGKRWPWKLLALCMGVILLLVLPLFWQIRKSLNHPNPLWRNYMRLLKKLKKAGLEIGKSEGPIQLKNMAINTFPEEHDKLAEAFDLFMEGHYGRNPTDDAAQEDLKRLTSEFRSVVKGLNLPKVDQKSIPH